MPHPAVRLKTDRLPAGPWIYGRQVEPPAGIAPGALVEVHDAAGRFFGHALYNESSDIRLRVLSRGKRSDWDRPADALRQRIAAASRLRTKTLRLGETGDLWRVVHAEGDDLPGLIVDRLGSCYVVEYHALGFHELRAEVERALLALTPEAEVVHRVPQRARRQESFEPDEESGAAEPELRWLHEHAVEYPIVPGRGHKTGWFCDQRENRVRVGALCAGRTVLDLCCNAGGFALQAARHGARRVTGVDLDEDVLARAVLAGERAGYEIEWLHRDAFHHLRDLAAKGRTAQVVVLDPHKLVRGKASLEEGKKKYLDLNALALGAVSPGGILATFSCSGALDLPSFLGIVFQAARRAERRLRVLELLGAGPDHPQRPEFPRSRYLKGALLAVD